MSKSNLKTKPANFTLYLNKNFSLSLCLIFPTSLVRGNKIENNYFSSNMRQQVGIINTKTRKNLLVSIHEYFLQQRQGSFQVAAAAISSSLFSMFCHQNSELLFIVYRFLKEQVNRVSMLMQYVQLEFYLAPLLHQCAVLGLRMSQFSLAVNDIPTKTNTLDSYLVR